MVGWKGRIEAASPDLVAKLEAGESPASLARSPGLGAVDLVAAIARAGLGDSESAGPALIQGPPARPRLEKTVSAESLAELWPDSGRPARLALAAGLLQVLDFWDPSHAAAQEADDLGERSTAAYWHLIAHRREPDAGNALYWARRVGRHPIHAPLAEASLAILATQDDQTLAARLLPGGTWSPASMIELATRSRPGSPIEAIARRLQRLEMIELLESSWRQVTANE